MKKIIFTLAAAVIAVPVLAQEPKIVAPGHDSPAVEMQRDHEAFKKAHEEHKAQMKATKEKMEKLVKEYNKLKDGKKKDAKRAEIEKEIGAIHEKQLEFKQQQLAQFEERLSRMKAEFDQENSAEGKQAWVNEKTDALIQANGDMKALFGPRHGGMRGPKDGKGPRMGKRPHKGFMGKGPRGPRPEVPAPDFDD